MGFEEEIARAAFLLKMGHADTTPGLAVPGNHDYCTASSARAGYFERVFTPVVNRRADRRCDLSVRAAGGTCVVDRSQFFDGESLAVGRAGRRRSRANPAAGRVAATLGRGAANLGDALSDLAGQRPARAAQSAHARPRRRGGGGSSRRRRLMAARPSPRAYYHPPSDYAPFPVVCAGSATQSGRWSYKSYTLEGYHLKAQSRVYHAKDDRFHDGEAFELELTGGACAAQGK